MRQGSYGLLAGTGLAVALALGAGGALAGAFNVTIDSALLSGSPAVLAFDFSDGGIGPPDNTATLSALISDGTQSSTSIIGNVTGTGPWTFSVAGDSFFNELAVTFDPMGLAVSFSFTTTDFPAESGNLPDQFSLFILNADPNAPTPFLITTDDPTGANALFTYDIGVGGGAAVANDFGVGAQGNCEQGLCVYTPEQQGFAFRVTPVQAVPEPTSLALLAAGMFGLLARRRLGV